MNLELHVIYVFITISLLCLRIRVFWGWKKVLVSRVWLCSVSGFRIGVFEFEGHTLLGLRGF